MDNKQNYRALLFFCITDVLILSIGHALNIGPAVLGGVLVFFLLLLVSHGSNFLAIMLFYLPWSPVMKLNSGDYTFYTIGFLLFFCYVLFIKELFEKKAVLRLQNLLLISVIAIYTLTVKLALGYDISLSYIVFLVMLILIPTYFRIYRNELSFEKCIIFFSAGIMAASFSSEILMNYPHMLRFIEITSWEAGGLTRLSGFYGDANYYAAHILTAICGLLILLFNKRNYERILLFICIITLVYLGFLSVSKMFILVLAAAAGVWLLSVLIQKGRAMTKISMLITFAASVIFIVMSPLFDKLIQMYLVRFRIVSDISSFTTGRSDILQDYFSYLINHPFTLLFGQGITQVYTGEIIYAAHNSFVQIIYQLGIIGSLLLVIWLIQLFSIKGEVNTIAPYSYTSPVIVVMLLVISCYGSWLALDILFADEFFLMPLLFLVGKDYIEGKTKNPDIQGYIEK